MKPPYTLTSEILTSSIDRVYKHRFQLFTNETYRNNKPSTKAEGLLFPILINYLCASIFFTKLAFGCAPTNLSTTSPFFTNKIAGILVIP
jgi:hypothetical protein